MQYTLLTATDQKPQKS